MEHLATYLNDHLAGAVTALDLLEHAENSHQGTPVGDFLTELRADITADRAELEAVMAELSIEQSTSRKVTAWLSERLAQAKLRLDDPAGGTLRLLETLDALAGGIGGKLALWTALAAAAERVPELQLRDFERLASRAREQRERLEPMRLEAARVALCDAWGAGRSPPKG